MNSRCQARGGGGGGGGGGGIFSYIRRLGSFFGDQHFEFQYFWGSSEKNLGMKIFGIFFLLYLWVFSMQFRVFF